MNEPAKPDQSFPTDPGDPSETDPQPDNTLPGEGEDGEETEGEDKPDNELPVSRPDRPGQGLPGRPSGPGGRPGPGGPKPGQGLPGHAQPKKK